MGSQMRHEPPWGHGDGTVADPRPWPGPLEVAVNGYVDAKAFFQVSDAFPLNGLLNRSWQTAPAPEGHAQESGGGIASQPENDRRRGQGGDRRRRENQGGIQNHG